MQVEIFSSDMVGLGHARKKKDLYFFIGVFFFKNLVVQLQAFDHGHCNHKLSH